MFRSRELYGILTLLLVFCAGWWLFAILHSDTEKDRIPIVLLFDDAEGLHAGTPVKTRGVVVGEVRRVNLAAGGRGTEVLCSLSKAEGASPRVGTRFWIVRPWFGGITSGGGGLDTLIKDSYIAYDIGDPTAPLLDAGSRVPGMRLPPEHPQSRLDLPPSPGDLEISVRFATNPTLAPAAPVHHRGIDVGFVTAVGLIPDGNGVEVQARIDREHRDLVTTSSIFWIDDVDVRATWSGVSLEGLESILSGAALSFYSPREEAAIPAPDNALFVGEPTRPKIKWSPPPNTLSNREDRVGLSGDDPVLAGLVTVHYSALESDWLSADDRFERTSPGILHQTLDGLPAVLTLALAIDGSRWISDGVGKPELIEEKISVSHSDGSVQEAGLAWKAEPPIDLALLRIPTTGKSTSFAPIKILNASEWAGPVDLYLQTEKSGWQRHPASLDAKGLLSGLPSESGDAVIVRAGQVIGLWRGNGLE